MTDPSNDQHDQELPTLNQAELQLRITFGPSRNQQPHDHWREVVRDLTIIGPSATPLMQDFVNQYRAGKVSAIASSSWVELYLSTRFSPLLAALLENDALSACNISEKCQLFEAGLTDLEEELTQYLWNSWEQFGEPWRFHAVRSLGKFGSPKCLEFLRVLKLNLSSKIPAQRAKTLLNPPEDQQELVFANEGDMMDFLDRGFGDSAKLLEEVEKAIQQAEERHRER